MRGRITFPCARCGTPVTRIPQVASRQKVASRQPRSSGYDYCSEVCTFWGYAAEAGPDDCWLWGAAVLESGYGVSHLEGKQQRAHRVAWLLTNGPIPPETPFVLHQCDVRYPPGDVTYRRCCNPAHLRLGTHRENMAEMAAKGRAATGRRSGAYTKPESRTTGDRNGLRLHPERVARGERAPNASLTWADVDVIRAAHRGGMSQSALGRYFGVTHSNIGDVVRYETWKVRE